MVKLLYMGVIENGFSMSVMLNKHFFKVYNSQPAIICVGSYETILIKDTDYGFRKFGYGNFLGFVLDGFTTGGYELITPYKIPERTQLANLKIDKINIGIHPMCTSFDTHTHRFMTFRRVAIYEQTFQILYMGNTLLKYNKVSDQVVPISPTSDILLNYFRYGYNIIYSPTKKKLRHLGSCTMTINIC